MDNIHRENLNNSGISRIDFQIDKMDFEKCESYRRVMLHAKLLLCKICDALMFNNNNRYRR